MKIDPIVSYLLCEENVFGCADTAITVHEEFTQWEISADLDPKDM